MQLTKTIYQDATRPITERVSDLLSQMTLAEKIGQMAQAEKNSIPPQDVTHYAIGSVLSGGGGNPAVNNVREWRKMVQAYIGASLHTRLGIPLIYGVDAVHGHNNVVNATIFPHNVGLGATRDAQLVGRIAQATAHEMLATNVHWNFAPAVSVPQDIRWGRSYEGYSENTALVAELGEAYVRGLMTQSAYGDWVLPSVKHFVGDGGTTWDSRKEMPYFPANNWQAASPNWRIDQGDTRIDEATLRRIHLAPYKNAIDAGALNVMVSFSSWNGLKMHAQTYLLTDVLKGEWGFKGFLVSDWMAVNHLSEDTYEAFVMGINAGLDMIMIPFDYKSFITDVTKAVETGDIALSRIDDAVSRILYAKFALGLFEKPLADEIYLQSFGGDAHRTLAREAVQKSAVLLKHTGDVLPLKGSQTVGVAGIGANDVGMACGGWTVIWQGSMGPITKGSTLLDGLKVHMGRSVEYNARGDFENPVDVAVVVVGEEPYAEGEGDRADLTLSAEDTALIAKVRTQCKHLILVVYSGRPVIITHVIDQCDVVVAAFLPGTEASALADVLVGGVPFTGKLSYTWYTSMAQLPLSHLTTSNEKPLFPYGHGLTL